ncbi:MAG: D-alanine--D-alanine ligase [Planctomycetota bacterium]
MAVLAGGLSSEHEVSRWSGERVLESLDRHRYRPISVLIEAGGSWVVGGLRKAGPLEGVAALCDLRCDVAFLALHGPFGEDGTIQGFLETAGLPYTGSGVAGSALCADKIRTKRLVAAAGFEVAADLTLPPHGLRDVPARLGFPVFVKNPYGGSTLEVRLARTPSELAAAVDELRPAGDVLLVERAASGRELTVPILDDEEGHPRALPVVEVRSDGDFFDFRNKYTAGVAQEIVPAPIPAEVARRLQEETLRIHRLLGLRAMSRSDFILSSDGSATYLETNSIPGLTPTSLLPLAAKSVGIPFSGVLTRLVEGAAAGRMGRPWSVSSARRGGRSTGSSTAATAARSSS